MAQISIDKIKVPKRTRTDMGDIDALAESMKQVGQLQEIVADADMRLIAGARRIKAAKKLGWNKIRVHVAKDLDDAVGKLLAERDENTCRKGFTGSEMATMYKRLEPLERKEAKDRAKAGVVRGGKKSRRGPNSSGVSSPRAKKDESKRTTAKVASAFGTSRRTLDKVLDLTEAAEADPSLKPLVDEMDRTGKIDGAHRKLRNARKDKARTADAAKAKEATTGDDHGVKIGDFRTLMAEMDDASVDLIFTDPPYSLDTLPLYGDLAKEAARVLKPGASLITYLGQYHLPEVLALMTPHIKFLWPLACVHTGRSSRMNFWGIVVKWKPMLWFVNGKNRRDVEVFVDDLVESTQEKGTHKWQQSLVEASYYIEQLTKPGELVLDPFCGGATTSIAARQLDRRWLTFEVVKDTAHLARKRIKEETNGSNG